MTNKTHTTGTPRNGQPISPTPVGETPPSPETLRQAYLELVRLRPNQAVTHLDVVRYLNTLGSVVSL
jgi:hypothetical protein